MLCVGNKNCSSVKWMCSISVCSAMFIFIFPLLSAQFKDALFLTLLAIPSLTFHCSPDGLKPLLVVQVISVLMATDGC